MGRPAKSQETPSFKTRPISSYFFSSSKPAANPPPSPPHHLGPSSQQSQPEMEEEAVSSGTDATISSTPTNTTTATTATTTTITASDSFDTTGYDTATDPFLDNPFNDPFNSHDDNIWDTPVRGEDAELDYAHTTDGGDNTTVELESLLDGTQAEKALKSIDNMDLMALQPSSESLRRLTLSPRKPKRALDFGNGSPGSKPMLMFSEKLAAEMGKTVPGDKYNFGGNSSSSPLKPKKPRFGTKEEDEAVVDEGIVVGGSDSESDADWDDKDVFVSAESSPQKTPEEKSEPPMLKDIVLSDDDFPPRARFVSKAPVELVESDSDMDDELFSGMNSALANPTPPSTTPSVSAPGDDVFGSDVELSDGDDLDTDETGTSAGTRRRSTRARARTAASNRPASMSRNGRVRRNSSPDPLLDFDEPIRPYKPRKPATKTLFSLDSLLKEKERKERIGYDLQVIKSQVTLDGKLLEDFGEFEEVTYSPLSVPKGVLTEQDEEDLKVIIKNTQAEIVEDIAEFFIRWPQKLVVDSLETFLTDADSVDHIVQRVIKHTRTEVQRTQFLMSPFLSILCSSPWTMPRSLFRWLVHIVATEQNQPVTLLVFSVIQKVLSQRTSLLGVDHQDLVRIFRMYGAKDEFLDEDWQVTPVTSETKNERTLEPDTPKFPRQNLRAVIKLINLTATLDPQFYDPTEIRKIINVLLRMTTDPIIGDIKSLLGATLVALLDAIPAHSWDVERNRICQETLKSLGTSSAFLLLTLHQLPALSDRIALIRRSIALAYLNQPPIPPGEVAPDLNELHRALFVDRLLQTDRKADFKAVGRRYQIYGYCLDDEEILAGYGYKALEPLSRKLIVTHGRIFDSGAAHMDRTNAKELIQRIFVRTELVLQQLKDTSSVQSTLGFPVQKPSATFQQ
ncbi:hypothetical protein K457DRAFT_134488 [Linnemannia elongata AG-77]|uniref:Uncharacterized protein n=1 Tax=Linnemannia elongata AG-77 TaxID=1314771 RepID=A0A197K798_9FUNG|nr:hypothetical protein K457DRAFT_134488 [Linnemannia elongata AG-77]